MVPQQVHQNGHLIETGCNGFTVPWHMAITTPFLGVSSGFLGSPGLEKSFSLSAVSACAKPGKK